MKEILASGSSRRPSFCATQEQNTPGSSSSLEIGINNKIVVDFEKGCKIISDLKGFKKKLHKIIGKIFFQHRTNKKPSIFSI